MGKCLNVENGQAEGTEEWFAAASKRDLSASGGGLNLCKLLAVSHRVYGRQCRGTNEIQYNSLQTVQKILQYGWGVMSMVGEWDDVVKMDENGQPAAGVGYSSAHSLQI